MITTRKIYYHDQKNYFEELQKKYGTLPSNHLEAIKLRMDFFKKFVLDRVSILMLYVS